MPGGGSKPGERRGGRKKGVPNKKTLEDTRKAEKTGVMPKEVMLAEMRFHYARFERIMASAPVPEADEAAQLAHHNMAAEALAAARVAAREAAPYFHAKLTAHKIGGDPNMPIGFRIEDLNTQQLDVLIARLEAAIGLAPAIASVEAGTGEATQRGDETLQ